MTYLLDGNVLIALAMPAHPMHARALAWFQTIEKFSTCPVTEGTLLRLHPRYARETSPAAAWETLKIFRAHPRHHFWPENFSYAEINPARLTGHRQITDAWLAELARRKRGKLATLDMALSVLWPDSTLLVPV